MTGQTADAPPAERTRWCRYHCGACHRHFASLAAFEKHRTGTFMGLRPRRCVTPGGKPRVFTAMTDEGRCRAYPNAVRTDVTIWTLTGALEKARERFGGGA